jgi:hypothetical protein
MKKKVNTDSLVSFEEDHYKIINNISYIVKGDSKGYRGPLRRGSSSGE